IAPIFKITCPEQVLERGLVLACVGAARARLHLHSDGFPEHLACRGVTELYSAINPCLKPASALEDMAKLEDGALHQRLAQLAVTLIVGHYLHRAPAEQNVNTRSSDDGWEAPARPMLSRGFPPCFRARRQKRDWRVAGVSSANR